MSQPFSGGGGSDPLEELLESLRLAWGERPTVAPPEASSPAPQGVASERAAPEEFAAALPAAEPTQPATQAEPVEAFRLIAVQTPGGRFACNLEAVAEIVDAPGLAPIPRAPRWLHGLCNLRGEILAVVDLGDFLTGQPLSELRTARMLVVESGSWAAGCLVERVLGLRLATPARSETTRAIDTPFAAATQTAEDGNLTVLAADRLLAGMSQDMELHWSAIR
ncbi:MAG TPA: chemotaxis protein CheW [Thermoanaerobaculia bacterium]|nr:chemotaxis protein CheW [Thermoanaerobaculia bacterium]